MTTWYRYPLGRTNSTYVLAAAEEFDGGRPYRNADGSLRIVTARGKTEEAANAELDRLIRDYK